ncbi:MAG: dihydroorotate dehydrogenase [Bacillota bacterium]|nr:dihydroorotate dehydrogenase [Bacillota bacterium]
MTNVNTAVTLGGLRMKNPVTTGSGTFGSGLEMKDYVDLTKLGAVTVKGTTLEPRPGNASPRIAETPAGVLNSIGLENPGVDGFIKYILPQVSKYGTPIIVNIAGSSVEDYGEITSILDGEEDVAALEINISCPNVKNGGMAFGTNPQTAYEAIHNVRKNTTKPIFAKLSPNVTDIVEMAKVAQKAGADGLSLINTLLGMAIDIKKKRPVLGNIMGGLSGPAIKPVALRMVYQVSQAVDLPIIGQGGIVCWQDAVEFLLAGATAVSVGTGNFLEPDATMQVAAGIEQYLIDNGYEDVKDIIGLAWRS